MQISVRTKRGGRPLGVAALAVVAALGCAEVDSPTAGDTVVAAAVDASGSATGSYVLIGPGGTLPAGWEEAVAQAGGTVDHALTQIGVAVVRSSAEGFDLALRERTGTAAVIPNPSFQLAPEVRHQGAVALASFGNPPTSGDDDFFYDLQWGHDAVNAPEAWEGGDRGAGVRLAILDSGIDATHPDLAPNLNVGLSASFIPGESFDQVPLFPAFSHGTHVAGIAAAADNAFGIIGVAPEAEIVAIKVLSAFTGTGDVGGALAGLVYAADIGADVANLSLGASFSHRGEVFDSRGNLVETLAASEVQELWRAMIRAAQYAHEAGTTIVASAGNAAIDRDGDRDRFHFPSALPHVISVAATAPRGWALDPSTDLDRPAPYSNYGKSAIDFAAPGGYFDVSLLGPTCTVFVLTLPCPAFDLVWSTVGAGWTFASGTSMAAPHVTGVAAILIGREGGSMHPAQVRAALAELAADLGKPGRDDLYGLGRVQAAEPAF